MDIIFGPVPINPVNFDTSIVDENWPYLNVISDVNFTANSPFVPCILSSVNVKLTALLKLFRCHHNLAWEHVIAFHVP